MRRKFVTFSMLLPFLFFIYMITNVAVTNKGQKTISVVKSNISANITNAHLTGKSPEVIIAFLNKQGIPHGDYTLMYEGSPELDRTISCRVPDVATTWKWYDTPASWSVTVVFYFDHNSGFNHYIIDVDRQI